MKRVLLLITILFCATLIVKAQNSSLQFAFLTDIHVAPNTPTEEALKNIINEINTQHLDFVLITGDLTNTGSDAELNAVKNAFDKLTIPYYVVSGNHETNWSESAGNTFIELWGNDRFIFTYNNYLFIGFATGPYMKMGDGHVKEEDIYWLQQQLMKYEAQNKTLIFAAHYPLTADLDNWYKVTDILKRYNARLAFCGHGHRLSAHNFDGIAGVMGRATVKSSSSVPGYNVVIFKNDSVFVFDKELNLPLTTKAQIALSLTNNEAISKLPSSPLPDYSVNKLYKLGNITTIQDTSSVFTGVALSNDTIVVYGNSKGELKAYTIYNNKPDLLWKKQFKGSLYATPVIKNNTVYNGTIDGKLFAANLTDGSIQWEIALKKPIISELVTEGDSLYVSAGNELYKINTLTGKIIWCNSDAKGQLQGKPTLSNNCIVLGAWDRHLYCIDKNNGKTRWAWNNGHQAILFSPGNVVPVVANNKVFIVAPDRYMTAIDLKEGKTIWRTNKYKVRESMGVSHDGNTIYAKLMNDSIIAVSTTTNQYCEMWAVNAGFGYEHNPCPIIEDKGTIYAGGKNGLLVAIDSKTQQIKYKYKCGNSSINKITPDHNNGVWISLIEGKIINITQLK